MSTSAGANPILEPYNVTAVSNSTNAYLGHIWSPAQSDPLDEARSRGWSVKIVGYSAVVEVTINGLTLRQLLEGSEDKAHTVSATWREDSLEPLQGYRVDFDYRAVLTTALRPRLVIFARRLTRVLYPEKLAVKVFTSSVRLAILQPDYVTLLNEPVPDPPNGLKDAYFQPPNEQVVWQTTNYTGLKLTTTL